MVVATPVSDLEAACYRRSEMGGCQKMAPIGQVVSDMKGLYGLKDSLKTIWIHALVVFAPRDCPGDELLAGGSKQNANCDDQDSL